MMPLLLAAVAALTLWAGGYLFGAARGRRARAALRVALDDRGQSSSKAERAAQDALAIAQQRRAALASELDAARAAERMANERATAEADARRAAEEATSESIGALRTALAASEAEQRELRVRLEDMLRPLAAQGGEARRRHAELEARINERLEAQGDELLRRLVSEAIGPLQERTGALRAVVAQAIRPLQEEKRVTDGLAQLHAGSGRGDLNRLLSAIAEHAGFALVVLCDARGLLLANSATGARNAEMRAGLSALVLTIADSSIQVGAPKPLAVTVHDTENQIVVTRIFEVDGERFLLSAVSKGRFVQPNVLDPALEKIERLMEDWAAAQLLPAGADSA